jgi:hypothetical protein
VHVENAAHLIGTVAPVRIDAAMPNSLKGSLAAATQPREEVLAH